MPPLSNSSFCQCYAFYFLFCFIIYYLFYDPETHAKVIFSSAFVLEPVNGDSDGYFKTWQKMKQNRSTKVNVIEYMPSKKIVWCVFDVVTFRESLILLEEPVDLSSTVYIKISTQH